MTTRRTPDQGPELRRRAEERLLAVRSRTAAPADLAGMVRLVHELQVHQVELELQNEELVLAREALEVPLARYADLYDFAPVGYVTVDAAGLVREINLAGAALLGREGASLVGEDLAGHLHPASREGFRAFLAAALASRTTLGRDLALQGRDGVAVPVHLEGLAAAVSGEPAGACRIVVTDLSELRRLEARALQAQKLEAVALLAAGVAHEINNPLAFLLEGMQTLQRALGRDAPDLVEALAITRDGCDGLERIRDVVKALSAFSNPQAGPRAAIDPGLELAAALRLASSELRHRARVVTHLAPLPAVRARPGELSQVFLNLLVNAAQACPEGGDGGAVVTVTTRAGSGGWAVIEVADSGCGMPPEVMARIFEPYFTTRAPGLRGGLGLALVHGLVTAAGGRVEVTSQVGEGSTFRVFLPPASGAASEVEASPEAVVGASAPVQAAGGVNPRPRVMVVDDEPQVARSVARSLASQFDVTVCGSGPEALGRLERGERFDAVVCDLMMPVMSGPALQGAMAERWPDLAGRFVFLTGGAFSAASQAFEAATPAEILEKPFDGKALREAVHRAAKRSC